MTGEGIGKALNGVASVAWTGLAIYVVWLLRKSLVDLVNRLTGFEGWGIKFSLDGGGQALKAAFEVAGKNPTWNATASDADRQKALDTAKRRRTVYEGAEILWVDDRPSNNRNESRMFRSFGALVTFACTTEEALSAIADGLAMARGFHVILSDMSRGMPPPVDPQAGLAMLDSFKNAGVTTPVIFYVGSLNPSLGTPPGAFGITERPDVLLTLVGDALERVRG